MRTVLPLNAHTVPLNAKRVFKGVIYDVYQWPQKRFDGTEATFEMLKRPDTVKVIAVKGEKIITIIDEQPSYKPKLTLPGGRHDIDSETELDCAKREVHEETGMVFKTWKLIDARQLHEKIEQIIYIFLATDFVSQDNPHLDVGEKITVQEMSFAEFKTAAEQDGDRHLPTKLLQNVSSLEQLLALSEYQGRRVTATPQ